MGHGLCAAHCACLLQNEDSYVYDPYRCDTCLDFIRAKFQGVVDADCIKGAMAEMEGHVKKLRRYLEGLEERPHLRFSAFVAEIRVKTRARNLDLDFFKNLSIREDCVTDDDRDSVVSIPPSLASGSSKRGSPGPLRPSPGSKPIKEEMATMKGQIDRMEAVMLKLLELPALKAVHPPLEGEEVTRDHVPRRDRSKGSAQGSRERDASLTRDEIPPRRF